MNNLKNILHFSEKAEWMACSRDSVGEFKPLSN
jgi:hypothetical protein